MARHGTKLSAHQIKDGSVTSANIADETIGSDDIAKDAVNDYHIASGSIDKRHMNESTAARLLPSDTSKRRYYEALAASTNDPNGQNPYLTRRDLKDSMVFWGAPYDSLTSAFSGDPNFSVRLDSSQLTLNVKGAGGTVVPVKMDHASAINLDSLETAMHVTTQQKRLVERLANLGFDPSDPDSPGVRLTQQIGRLGSVHFTHSLEPGQRVLFTHPEIVDDDFERQISIYTAKEPGMTAGHFGHGFYPIYERSKLYNYSTSLGVDDPNWYVSSSVVDVDLRDTIAPMDGAYWLNQGLRGLVLAKTNCKVQSVTILSGRQARIEFDSTPPDENLPLVLSNVETGKGIGYTSLIDQSQFETWADLGPYYNRKCQIASDSQSSAYVLGLDTSGAVWCKRIHPSGTIAEVTFVAATSVAPWIDMRFDTIAASIVLVHDAPTIIRTLYIFLSNASGDRVVLASEDLPNSFGTDARQAEEIQLIMYGLVIEDSTWEGFIPNMAQAVSVGQGLSTARGVILAADANTIRWISLPHLAQYLSTSCQYGTFPDTEGRGASFKACAGKNTIELIARSSDAQGQWYKKQMQVNAVGALLEITEGARGASIVNLPDHGFAMADICYVDVSSSSGEDDYVVFGTLDPESGEATLVWHFLDSGCILIKSESKTIRQTRTGKSLKMIGGIDATLVISDVFPENQSFGIMAVANSDGDYMSTERVITGEVLESWHCPARYGVSPYDELITDETLELWGCPPIYGEDPFGTSMTFVSRTTRQVSGLLAANSHDTCAIVAVAGSLQVLRKKPNVTMRSQNMVNNHSAMVPVDVSDLIQAEGAAMSSIKHLSSLNEWLFVSGGIESSTGTASASNQLVALRKKSDGSWSWISGLLSNTVLNRCYHGQYTIGCLAGYAPGGIPVNSALVFMFGGRTRGKIEDPAVGNLVAPELCRVVMQNLNSVATPTSAMASGCIFSGSLQRTIPSMVRPTIFLSYDGSSWHMFFVDPPNVYRLSESDGYSFFGTTLPGEANAIRLNPETAVMLSSRAASAVIQYKYAASPGEADVVWNPDRNETGSVPSKTRVLLYGSEAVEDYSSLKLLTLDPADMYTPVWSDIIVEGNEIPVNRVDASLVYAGIHASSIVVTHHLFYMFGGVDASGNTMSDLWLLDYYIDAYNNHHGFWSKLGDMSNHGLMRAASCVASTRRPDLTDKDGNSTHSVYFYGGRGEGGANLSDLTAIQLPDQMKGTLDLNIPAMAVDMGGHTVPYLSWIMSEPINIAQVGTIGHASIDAVLEAYDDDSPSSTISKESIVYIGLAFDDPSQVYYVPSTGGKVGPVQWGDFDDITTFEDFALGLKASPLQRSTSFANARNMYILLGIYLPDAARRLLVHSVTLPVTINAMDSGEDAIVWERRTDTDIKVMMPTPRTVMVENTDESETLNMRVVITGPLV